MESVALFNTINSTQNENLLVKPFPYMKQMDKMFPLGLLFFL